MTNEQSISASLEAFVADRLSALGLDAETYAPYLLPVVLHKEDDVEDEWEGVLELLQASSETHSDDENCWKQLRIDVTLEHERLAEQEEGRREQQRLEREKVEENRLQLLQAETLAKQSATEPNGNKKDPELDAAKKALLARFAYEDSDDDLDEEEDTDELKTAPITTAAAATNAPVAPTGKQAERQKTKQAKESKVAAKEERRKRAQKGERKR
ncbi:hypothetical protein MPSEU_000418300 [Mayamaea pseudoterrestris]|nr:hypothetical protein MPSEU_000418300 [Mayamaea pseudoterrestris]